jgi:hypothetical protein
MGIDEHLDTYQSECYEEVVPSRLMDDLETSIKPKNDEHQSDQPKYQ